MVDTQGVVGRPQSAEPRVMIGIPLYNLLSSQFFSNWITMEQTHVMGAVTVDGAYITHAMDEIVKRALQYSGWSRLIVLEHDMIPPQWAFTRMAHYEPQHAIVGSIYFSHRIPHNCHVFVERGACNENELGHLDVITADTVRTWTENPGLHRCDAVGFGLTSIARHVLEDWDERKPMFGMDNHLASHDLWFCRRAREQGYKVFVDSMIVCDHLTTVPIGLSDNQTHADVVDYDRVVDFSYAEP